MFSSISTTTALRTTTQPTSLESTSLSATQPTSVESTSLSTTLPVDDSRIPVVTF